MGLMRSQPASPCALTQPSQFLGSCAKCGDFRRKSPVRRSGEIRGAGGHVNPLLNPREIPVYTLSRCCAILGKMSRCAHEDFGESVGCSHTKASIVTSPPGLQAGLQGELDRYEASAWPLSHLAYRRIGVPDAERRPALARSIDQATLVTADKRHRPALLLRIRSPANVPRLLAPSANSVRPVRADPVPIPVR